MELLRPSFEICHLIDESEVGRNCRLAYAVAEPMCFAPVAHPYTRARNRSTEILARTCSLPLLETLKSLASIRTRSFRLSEKLSSPNLFHRWSHRFNEPR